MKTISEIRKEGISALSKRLGPVDMARFIQSYEIGSGDYTKERPHWLPDNPVEVKERLLKRQKKLKNAINSLHFSDPMEKTSSLTALFRADLSSNS